MTPTRGPAAAGRDPARRHQPPRSLRFEGVCCSGPDMPSIRPGSSCVLPGDASPAVVLTLVSHPAFRSRIPAPSETSFHRFRGTHLPGVHPGLAADGADFRAGILCPSERSAWFCIRTSRLSLAGYRLPDRTEGPSDVSPPVRLRRRMLAHPVLPPRRLSARFERPFRRSRQLSRKNHRNPFSRSDPPPSTSRSKNRSSSPSAPSRPFAATDEADF
jgi:hypothetical protein